MENRDELINNLRYAVQIINKNLELNDQRNKIRTQYVQPKQYAQISLKKSLFCASGIVKILLMFFAYVLFLCFWTMSLELNLFIVIFLAVFLTSLTALIVDRAIIKKNLSINQYNEQSIVRNQSNIQQCEAFNNQLMQQEIQIINQIKALNQEYQKNIAPWYPSDYCYLTAAKFFLNAVENHKADSIKEAVNLYDDAMHKQRVEENQKIMMKQQEDIARDQKIGNLLTLGQIVMQAGVISSVNRNTQAVNNVGQSVNQHSGVVNDFINDVRHGKY